MANKSEEKSTGDGDNDFDPHENRNVKKSTTTPQAFMHFLKASIGTGVLAMPSAFSNAGYVLGILLTIFIGIVAVYGLHVLIGSMYILCKRKRVGYLTYSEAMTIGFEEGPPILRWIVPIATPFVDGFLALYQFGICCVYVVFIAESVKQLVDQYFTVLDIRLHMCFLLVPLFLIFNIRNLRLLAPFSAFANFLLLIGFGAIIYYIAGYLPPLSDRTSFQSIGMIPIFFGTVLFALEAVGVILAIEANMENPKDYLKPFGVMNVGMTVVLVLYTALGFLGYWKYGEDIKGSITLNIPEDEILAQVVKLLFAVTTWISYSLQGFVTVDIVYNKYLVKHIEDTSKHTLYEIIFRIFTVLATFVCAVAVPDLSIFLSLVGAFCLSILGFIFPALLQICVEYSTGYGKAYYRLIKNILLASFGAIGGIFGTYVSIKEIIATYE